MVDVYAVGLFVVGLAILGAVVLPRALADKPLSMPIIYVAGGFILFALPHGFSIPNLVEHSEVVERVSELVVIVALMGAGLKIDRPFSWSGWKTTWRLLGITMPLTIAATALLGWFVLDLNPGTSILLGAVIAPTDPVLASDVEAGAPLTNTEEEESTEVSDGAPLTGHDGDSVSDGDGHVRFGLTSEAGLNDGLAFPATNLAIAVAGVEVAGGLLPTLGKWVAVDVVYQIVVGTVAGYFLGWLLARIIFELPSTSKLAEDMAGAEALAGTLLIYAATELVGGYGFIAVFVGSLTLRHYEWEHDYYRTLDRFAVIVERLLMAVVLVAFGGAIASGLLAPLTVLEIAIGATILLIIRPLSGLVGLTGLDVSWPERLVISGFGIRGIGSFYYLSHALAESTFKESELLVDANQLWALVGFIVLGSVVLHGATASYAIEAIDRWRYRQSD